MRFVVVTGMSGGGKATAIRMLEDEGYYCVDNLPVRLIDKFTELMFMPGSEISKVVLGLDVRADQPFAYVEDVLAKLREKGYPYEILFMDASDETLIKRYKETRRAHPMAPDGRVEDGIRAEREVLRGIKANADYVIDTSRLLTRELKEELVKIFLENRSYNSLMISVTSFGFKKGIPVDADLVFDVRFLPNPYYVENMRKLTGLDDPVRQFVLSYGQSAEFLDRTEGLLRFLIPHYIEEGKRQLITAIGCTGGCHRSVVLAGALCERLRGSDSFAVRLSHRHLKREVRAKE